MSKEIGKKIAVFAVNGETVFERFGKREEQRVFFVHTNDKEWVMPGIHKIAEKKFKTMKPGEFFDEGFLGVKLFFPREEDVILVEEINGYTVIIQKLFSYSYHYFEDGGDEEYLNLANELLEIIRDRITMPSQERVFSFIESLFGKHFSVRGKTNGQRVNSNTPCHDFFHADIDGIAISFGKPIERRFGLEKFDFENGVIFHSYYDITEEDSFWTKYPQEDLGTEKFTVRKFCEMVYDIIKKKHNTTEPINTERRLV